jgi:plastocyanin
VALFFRSSRWLLLFWLLGEACLLVSCRNASNHRSLSALFHQASAIPRATITIPRSQMLFTPFILVIQPGTRVSWQNRDGVAHTIVTTASSQAFLNPQAVRLSIPAGQTSTFAFMRPGLYDYFDPTQASWNRADRRVSARPGVPHYPLAMEGILWVQGPLTDLSSPVSNSIIPGHDEFSQDFIALPLAGTIIWHNADQDDHIIAPVPGWQAPINPLNPGQIVLKGTDAQPGGGTEKLTLSIPGLYYYYCPLHASVQSLWKRAQAHKDASEAPLPMEGFILVAARS